MLLALITFLAVTGSLVGGYMVVSEFLHPDENRVRRRLASEFTKDQPQALPSALYKKVDQLRLDPDQGLPNFLAPEAAASVAPKIGNPSGVPGRRPAQASRNRAPANLGTSFSADCLSF